MLVSSRDVWLDSKMICCCIAAIVKVSCVVCAGLRCWVLTMTHGTSRSRTQDGEWQFRTSGLADLFS